MPKRYEQIAADLRRAIRSGELSPGEQILRHAAVRAVYARKHAAGAVHFVASPAIPAQSADDVGVQDHSVAGREVRDRRSDLLDPASVLVAKGERKRGCVSGSHWPS